MVQPCHLRVYTGSIHVSQQVVEPCPWFFIQREPSSQSGGNLLNSLYAGLVPAFGTECLANIRPIHWWKEDFVYQKLPE